MCGCEWPGFNLATGIKVSMMTTDQIRWHFSWIMGVTAISQLYGITIVQICGCKLGRKVVQLIKTATTIIQPYYGFDCSPLAMAGHNWKSV